MSWSQSVVSLLLGLLLGLVLRQLTAHVCDTSDSLCCFSNFLSFRVVLPVSSVLVFSLVLGLWFVHKDVSVSS